MAKKVLSDDLRRYYRNELAKLLLSVDNTLQPTLCFYKVASCFSNNSPLLRKCLRTLEHDGLINNVQCGWNYDKWILTEKGEKVKQTHAPMSYYYYGEFKLL